MNGYGEYTLGDHIIYKGEFKDGIKHGRGRETIH